MTDSYLRTPQAPNAARALLPNAAGKRYRPPLSTMSQQDLRKRPGWLLWQLHHSLEQHSSAELAAYGLTLTSFGALQMIATSPGVSTAEIARQSLVTPQNMSVTITRLVEEARVTRTPHEVHGRVQKLALTSSGRVALKKAWQIRQSDPPNDTGGNLHDAR